jgi:hypothetical protein
MRKKKKETDLYNPKDRNWENIGRAGVVLVIALVIMISGKIMADKAKAETDAAMFPAETSGTFMTNEAIEEAMTYEAEETTEAETETETTEAETETDNFFSSEICTPNSTEGTATEVITDDFTLLCRMVRIECGESSGDVYYQKCYLQTAVALNRLAQGWGDTLTDVLMAEGQFYGWGYDTYDWSTININIPDLQQAVLDCLEYNDTPENLVFADSRHNHEGTDTMDFYMEIEGQDFYLSK